MPINRFAWLAVENWCARRPQPMGDDRQGRPVDRSLAPAPCL